MFVTSSIKENDQTAILNVGNIFSLINFTYSHIIPNVGNIFSSYDEFLLFAFQLILNQPHTYSYLASH